jgi:hypothetical protein
MSMMGITRRRTQAAATVVAAEGITGTDLLLTYPRPER